MNKIGLLVAILIGFSGAARAQVRIPAPVEKDQDFTPEAAEKLKEIAKDLKERQAELFKVVETRSQKGSVLIVERKSKMAFPHTEVLVLTQADKQAAQGLLEALFAKAMGAGYPSIAVETVDEYMAHFENDAEARVKDGGDKVEEALGLAGRRMRIMGDFGPAASKGGRNFAVIYRDVRP